MPTEVTTPPASLTTTGGTDTLYSTATGGVYALTIDLTNMQAGDSITIRGQAKVRSSGTLRNVFAPVVISGAQTEPNIQRRTLAIVAPQGCQFTITRTAGVDRTYAYRVDRIAACSVVAENTLTTTGAEDTLSTTTTNGTFVLLTDHGNMAGGDTVVLRMKTASVTGGALTVADMLTMSDAQDDTLGEVLRQSVSEPSDYQLRATIELTAGVNHDIPWALCLVAP